MSRRSVAALMLCGQVVFVAIATGGEKAAVLADAALKVKTHPLVIPSVRGEQLRIYFMVENLTDKAQQLTAKAAVADFETGDVALSAKPQKIALAPKFSGETSFVISAKGLETWSHWDPQLHYLDVELERDGKSVGKLPRVRFGYRDFWSEKGSFYINGKRVLLFGGNHNGRRSDREMKYGKYARFTADTIRGAYKVVAKTCDLADRHGHYLFFAFAWFEPTDRETLYEFGNHPSIVGHALGHTGYYSGPHGHPMQVGAIISDEEKAKEQKVFEIPKQYHEWDPSRVYGFYVRGVGGDFRSLMWDLGWGVPAQSQEEWMSFWAKNKEQVEPFFPQEFALMRLGANQVRLDRHYGQSALVEHMARYLGDESYRMFDDTMVESYTPGVKRPKNEPNSKLLYRMKDYIYSRVVPVWRVYGNAHMLLHVDGHPQVLVTRGKDEPSPLADSYRRLLVPVYFFIGGPKQDFVSKDHLFYAGEKIAKSGIIINDAADDTDVRVDWKVTYPNGKVLASGGADVSVKQGESEFLPIELTAPDVAAKTILTLSADCKDKDGELVRSDSAELRVFPKAQPGSTGGAVLLIDSSGATREALEKLGVSCTLLSTDANAAPENAKAISTARLLIIGKNSYPDAVKVLGNATIQEAVRGGLNVVVLAQRNRYVMGLKLEYTGSRDVYIRAKDSPLLAGLHNADLANWRQESKMLPAYPSFDTESLWWWQGHCYQGQFNRWRQRRAWHWSNKAMVATFCFEKPQFGNFRVLLDAHFDLLYTPLVEFQSGKGRILLNQLDLTDHHGIDPVATLLLARIIAEYSAPGTRALTPVGAVSDPGVAALNAFRMATKKGIEGNVVFLLPEDLDELDAKQAQELRSFVEKGGALLTALKTPEQANKLPGRPVLGEKVNVFNPAVPDDPVFAGLGMSDLFLRKMHALPAVTKLGEGSGAVAPSGIAAVAKVGKGRVVVLQIPPEELKEAEEFWGRSKVLRTYATVLTSLGGLSEVEPDPLKIGGWGIVDEWLPGYAERVPKKAPRVRRSKLYEQPALDWDPDAHVCW